MPRTLKRAPVAPFASTSSLPTLTRPLYSSATASTAGAIARHGAHQAAQKSTKTGVLDFRTPRSKLLSVISIVLAPMNPPKKFYNKCRIAWRYDLRVPFASSRNRRPIRVVISGFGCVTPLGNSREELWDGFRNARSGIHRISAFDPSAFPVQIAGEVRGIDPYQYFQPKERGHVSRAAALAIAA